MSHSHPVSLEFPDELAAENNLGERFGSYPYRKVLGILSLFVYAFLMISLTIGALLLGLIFVLASLVSSHPSKGTSDLGALLLGGSFVVLFLWGSWLSLKSLITCSRHFGSTLYVYKEGLILVRGRKTRLLRFEQVSEVQESEKRSYIRGRYAGTSFTYTLRLVDGKKLVFTSLMKDIVELGEGISLLVSLHHQQ